MVGAKVNSRIVGFDTRLQNGDIVEILTSNAAKGPSRDWLNLCQSNSSRIKIKQWFKRERRDENIQRGRASFESELRHAGFNPGVLSDPELVQALLQKLSQSSLDDVYASIGYGGMTALKAVNRIRDELAGGPPRNIQPAPEKLMTEIHGSARRNESGVVVEGMDTCMVKFSKCCTPVPGDDIIGFITKGFGVSVHRRDCPNVRRDAPTSGAAGSTSAGPTISRTATPRPWRSSPRTAAAPGPTLRTSSPPPSSRRPRSAAATSATAAPSPMSPSRSRT